MQVVVELVIDARERIKRAVQSEDILVRARDELEGARSIGRREGWNGRSGRAGSASAEYIDGGLDVRGCSSGVSGRAEGGGSGDEESKVP